MPSKLDKNSMDSFAHLSNNITLTYFFYFYTPFFKNQIFRLREFATFRNFESLDEMLMSLVLLLRRLASAGVLRASRCRAEEQLLEPTLIQRHSDYISASLNAPREVTVSKFLHIQHLYIPRLRYDQMRA